jgi:uncharacterized protein YraI
MELDWFKTTFWLLFLAICTALLVGASSRTDVLAQASTPDSSDVIVTVNYSEQINVRNGPGTVLYDIIGNLQPGDTARALGVSPGRDWVEIEFPAGPGGVGWVYSSFISISSGNLQLVEPPPTVTPLTTPTIDPTLAAAYVFEPTETRMPTFTAPPPLQVPHFTAMPAVRSKNSVPLGAFVIGTGILGVVGYLISLLRR